MLFPRQSKHAHGITHFKRDFVPLTGEEILALTHVDTANNDAVTKIGIAHGRMPHSVLAFCTAMLRVSIENLTWTCSLWMPTCFTLGKPPTVTLQSLLYCSLLGVSYEETNGEEQP